MLRDELLEFIRSSIKTVWSLELIILMRHGGDRTWSVEALVGELRGSRNIVQDALATFERAGLVRPDGDGCRYGPATPELDRLVDELEGVYAERPAMVVNAIVTAQNDKLRAFANAFRIKRD